MRQGMLRYTIVSMVVLAWGCAEDIKVVPPPTGVTFAVFDPSASPPQVPTPTDLVMDQTTGLLNVPVADATEQPAQNYLDTFLNTLDGFPTTATAEVHFTGELDEKTVTEKNILAFEMDPSNPSNTKLLTGLKYEYRAGSDSSMVRVWNYAGWQRNMRYVFFVTTGVKDKAGKAVARSALFELAAGDKTLCAWEADRAWDAGTGTCSTPASGVTPSGCCSFNYSALVESSVKAAVRKAAEGTDKTGEEIEREVKAAVLKSATDFELMRRAFEGLFAVASAAKVDKKDIALLWSFKTVGLNQGVFNPSAVPPAVPTPTDLIRDPVTGLLGIPEDPAASDAEKEFNAYLRTLDGYPNATSGSAAFVDALDDTSVKDGFVVFEIDRSGAAPKAAKATDVTATYNTTTNQVSISRKGGWKRATTHVVIGLGNDKGLKNKDGTKFPSPTRTALMHLVLSPNPLCKDYDKATATCKGAPLISTFIDDPKDKTDALTGKQKAALFETMRQGYSDLLTLIAATDTSVKREEISLFWTFTTSTQTEMIFDPTTGVIPFPNDALLDPTTGKVSIPASPGETATEKALREGLNTLDGFSTTGAAFAPFVGKIDPASIQGAAIALNAATSLPIAMKFEVDESANLLTATPIKPLKENTQYVLVLVSKPKKDSQQAEGGLKDDKGRYVVPASATVLMRNRHPVYDETTKKSLVSVVDDATAAQLEPARKQYEKLFNALKILQIEREHVPAFWGFTTQSITKPLTQLRALPWQSFAAVDQNKPKFMGATLDPTFTGWPATAPKSNLGGWAQGVFISWNALDPATGAFLPDPTKGKVEQVPFLLTVPSGTMPATGWPVVIYQHGIYGSIASGFRIFDEWGKAGYAVVAFDLPFHGARSVCVKDAECDAGTCDVATGKCSTKLKDTNGNGTPDASGNDAFLRVDNPFAIRDNIRQYVIDASALLRTIALGGAAADQGIPGVILSPADVNFHGVSLGAIIGHLILATDSLIKRAVLTVPGSTNANIFLAENGSPAFSDTKKTVLAAMGITEGTADYVQLVTTFNWIVDPADAANFAGFLTGATQLDDLTQPGTKITKKEILYQFAEKDGTIPLHFGQYVAGAAGFDTTKSIYTGQDHDLFYQADPDVGATQAARIQATTFVKTGAICTPTFTATTGSCQ